jgi:hypothetical protein
MVICQWDILKLFSLEIADHIQMIQESNFFREIVPTDELYSVT